MSEFNISSWLKDQYLTEAGLGSTKSQSLANAINAAMLQIDDSMSYTDFADAVASILIDEYGTHNFTPFMEVLHARLGMNESINEDENLSPLDEFLKYFKSYDAYVEYIDDGGQYRRANDNNNQIIAMFKALSPEDKEVAFKATQDYFESDRGRNAFKL
jgi:hypothetical protein